MDQPDVARVQLAALGALPPGAVLAPDASDADLPDDDGGLVPPGAVLGRQILGEGGKVFDLRAEQTKGRGQPLGVGRRGEDDGGMVGSGGGHLCWAAAGGRGHFGGCRCCFVFLFFFQSIFGCRRESKVPRRNGSKEVARKIRTEVPAAAVSERCPFGFGEWMAESNCFCKARSGLFQYCM